MDFKSAIKNEMNQTQTTNGMGSLVSSKNACVDLFYQIGASRGRDVSGLFKAALAEDEDTALRIVLWARDVRGGAGERQVFRGVLKQLENTRPDLAIKLLNRTAEVGRWDDLLVCENAETRGVAFGLIKTALEENNVLCAKWMPRKGPVAKALRLFLGLENEQAYRKYITQKTRVVEQAMCAKLWNEIDFSKTPSLASIRYKNAFQRNAPEAYSAYIAALSKGDPTVKINAGAVYPHDVLSLLKSRGVDLETEQLVTAQWEALPNFLGSNSILPMVDVSGSMECPVGNTSGSLECVDVAVALGLYISQKNKGDFADMVLTFDSDPEFVIFDPEQGIVNRYEQLRDAAWGGSTNIEGAFKQILDLAIRNKIEPRDMPRILLVLSDMQFDEADSGFSRSSALDVLKERYMVAGYEIPSIVFWNLNSHDNIPVSFDQKGTALISGFSPAILKAVLSSDLSELTPESIMAKAVMIERYDI